MCVCLHKVRWVDGGKDDVCVCVCVHSKGHGGLGWRKVEMMVVCGGG